MLFRRAKADKPNTPEEQGATEAVRPPAIPRAVPVQAVAELTEIPGSPETPPAAKPKARGYTSTADLDPAAAPSWYGPAHDAIHFADPMRGRDYNVFIAAASAFDARESVVALIRKLGSKRDPAPDWVYVPSLESPSRLLPLRLPHRRGVDFVQLMAGAIDDLGTAAPAAFATEIYRVGQRAIEAEFRSEHDHALDALRRKAQSQNITILRTPSGFGLAPMHEGKVVKSEVYQQLPEAMRRDIEQRIDDLEKELQDRLTAVPAADKTRRRKLLDLETEIAEGAVASAFADLRAAFADVPDAAAHVARVEADLVRNVGLFLRDGEEQTRELPRLPCSRDPKFARYVAQVLLPAGGSSTQGAPVIDDLAPTFRGVFGYHENSIPVAGALHRANGGYLIADAAALVGQGALWREFKRVLASGQLGLGADANASCAETMPLDVKVVLVGTRDFADRLVREDAEFARLFQMRASIDPTVHRSSECDQVFARLLRASVIDRYGLRHFDADAVELILDESERTAGAKDRLPTSLGPIADLMREADASAKESGGKVVTRDDVERVFRERRARWPSSPESASGSQS